MTYLWKHRQTRGLPGIPPRPVARHSRLQCNKASERLHLQMTKQVWSLTTRTIGSETTLGAEKNNKQKTHKHFSDGPCGTIVPGTNPHPFQGQTGQNGDFTVELNRERPVCPRDGSHFVPGRGPICPKDGSCLSRTPSRRKCLCLLVFFLPDYSPARNYCEINFENILPCN